MIKYNKNTTLILDLKGLTKFFDEIEKYNLT